MCVDPARRLIFAGMVNKKVIVAGLCKDVEATIGSTMEKLRETAALFADHRMIIYENNSQDNTKEMLQKIAGEKIIVKCEQFSNEELLQSGKMRTWNYQPYRVEMIANARNKVLDIIGTNDELKTFDYLLWIDLDFKDWDIAAIAKCFDREDWDAVT